MSNDLERYLIQKATLMGTPIKATLELTPFCNLNCRMCYIRHSMKQVKMNGGLQPASYWENIIPELKELGILFVALIGGEPFLYPWIQSLYEKLYVNGFYINITTNATLLAQGIPEWLKEKPPRYMTVSLYGASNRTYELLTGKQNGFSEAINGLENLLSSGIPVKLNYVAVPENKDDLEKIFRIKEQYHLPILATSYCFPPVYRLEKEEYRRLTPSECALEELQIMKLNSPEKYQKWMQYLAEEKYQQHTVKHTKHIYCHAGISTFWITWKGEMVPCGMMRKIAIKANYGHLQKNWELLKKTTSGIRTSLQCAQCQRREICDVCPAIMEAETGDTNNTPEYMCQVTSEIIQLCKKKIGYNKIEF